MTKRSLLAALVVFLVWSILDFLIHGVILASSYGATADLWRPPDELKMGLMRVVVLIAAVAFVLIYALLVEKKSIATGLQYGILYGIGVGVGMGYGTYSVMPLPYEMALVWFLGSVVEAAVAGVLVGLIMRKSVSVSGKSGSAAVE